MEKEDLRAGDIVFFNTDGKGISHAGIYMGDGLLGQASVNKGAEISELSETYYATRYVTARRILSDDQYRKRTINP
ncbi:C40 family peptidase [Paenibacillus thiaminolyticus]|uniref:C40 family peptidase n=1 Tax=Paenibacillus thiaminolyticus TaxID=49283 RepID=UPI0032B1A2A2